MLSSNKRQRVDATESNTSTNKPAPLKPLLQLLARTNPAELVAAIHSDTPLLSALKDKLPALQTAVVDALSRVSVKISDLVRVKGKPDVSHNVDHSDNSVERFVSVSFEVGPNKVLWEVQSQETNTEGDTRFEVMCGMWTIEGEDGWSGDKAEVDLDLDYAGEILLKSGIERFQHENRMYYKGAGWTDRALRAFIWACACVLDDVDLGKDDYGLGPAWRSGCLEGELEKCEEDSDEEEDDEDEDEDEDE